MTSGSLTVAREFLERALSCARNRRDERAIGERICELMEMQELEECRTMVDVQAHGCAHRLRTHFRRASVTVDGRDRIGADCTQCGVFVLTTMPTTWDGTLVVDMLRGNRVRCVRITL